MRTTHPLTDAGQRAVRAANALAKATRARGPASGLTLAEHASVMQSFSLTIDYLCGDTCLVPSILALVGDTRDRYARLDNPLGRYFTAAVTEVRTNTELAQAHLLELDLSEAWLRVEGDANRLAAWQPTAVKPKPTYPAGIPARLTQTLAAIRGLLDTLDTQQRPIADAFTALTWTAALVHAIETAYRREAQLLALAYAAARFTQAAPASQLPGCLTDLYTNAEFADDALRSAARTLATASDALHAAARIAHEPARREARAIA